MRHGGSSGHLAAAWGPPPPQDGPPPGPTQSAGSQVSACRPPPSAACSLLCQTSVRKGSPGPQAVIWGWGSGRGRGGTGPRRPGPIGALVGPWAQAGVSLFGALGRRPCLIPASPRSAVRPRAASLPALGPTATPGCSPSRWAPGKLGRSGGGGAAPESSAPGTRADTFASSAFIHGLAGVSGVVPRPEVSNVLREVRSPLFTCGNEDSPPARGRWRPVLIHSWAPQCWAEACVFSRRFLRLYAHGKWGLTQACDFKRPQGKRPCYIVWSQAESCDLARKYARGTGLILWSPLETPDTLEAQPPASVGLGAPPFRPLLLDPFENRPLHL